jgi:hypothetical protein
LIFPPDDVVEAAAEDAGAPPVDAGAEDDPLPHAESETTILAAIITPKNLFINNLPFFFILSYFHENVPYYFVTILLFALM